MHRPGFLLLLLGRCVLLGLRFVNQDVVSIERHPMGVRVVRLRLVWRGSGFGGAGVLYRSAVRRIDVKPAVDERHLRSPCRKAANDLPVQRPGTSSQVMPPGRAQQAAPLRRSPRGGRWRCWLAAGSRLWTVGCQLSTADAPAHHQSLITSHHSRRKRVIVREHGGGVAAGEEFVGGLAAHGDLVRGFDDGLDALQR